MLTRVKAPDSSKFGYVDLEKVIGIKYTKNTDTAWPSIIFVYPTTEYKLICADSDTETIKQMVTKYAELVNKAQQKDDECLQLQGNRE